jgi:HSP20 family protein
MAALYDPFRAQDGTSRNQGPRRMPIDLYRDGDHFVLNADLPGIDPASVDVDVDGALLSIRAERAAKSTDGAKWLARESRTGSFLRQLTLGDGVDRDGISATYDAGVLSVLIPVAEKAKSRKITISSPSAEPVGTDSREPVAA